MRLVLASASPRRAELLRAAGFEFDVIPADVDESFQPGERAESAVVRLAEMKAASVAGRSPDAWVLGADTTVVVDGDALGKPVDTSDARRMLQRLSGRTHEVLTGICVRGSGRSQVHVEISRVRMTVMTDEEIAWYASSGEPLDKAGAYAVQGMASRFVEAVEGSYSNVVGLPISSVYRLLKALGCDILGNTKF